VQRRHGPAAPAFPDHHPERPRPLGDRADDGAADERHQVGEDHPDDQLPEAAQHQQDDEQSEGHGVQDPPGAEGGQPAHHRPEAGQVDPGQPADHGGVEGGQVDGQPAQAAAEDQDSQDQQHHRGHQPPDPAGLEMVG
jgi:hypothetical protein